MYNTILYQAGYFILDSQGMGGIISRYYRKRFKNKRKFQVSAEDLASLFSRINSHNDDRFDLLADFLTLGERDWGAMKPFYFPLLCHTDLDEVKEAEGWSSEELISVPSVVCRVLEDTESPVPVKSVNVSPPITNVGM